MTQNITYDNFRKVTYPGVCNNAYMISNDGKVFSLLTNKFLKPYQDKDGYFKIGFKRSDVSINTTMNIFIHRLVAWEWCHENRDINLVVDHLDGNKQNNVCTNLKWVTIKENTNRADALGLKKRRGEYCNTNKYPEKMIHEICKMMQDGMTNMDIWRKYSGKLVLNQNDKEENSLYGLIYRLRKRQIWPDVTKQYVYDSKCAANKIWLPKSNSFFTEEDVRKICEMYCDKNLRVIDIVQSFGITKDHPDYMKYTDHVSSILRGEAWEYISKDYPILEKNTYRSSRNPDIDQYILNLISQGKSDDEIIQDCKSNKIYGSGNVVKSVKRRLYKFRKIQEIPENSNVSLKDIENISNESWAANQ